MKTTLLAVCLIVLSGYARLAQLKIEELRAAVKYSETVTMYEARVLNKINRLLDIQDRIIQRQRRVIGRLGISPRMERAQLVTH